MNLSNPTSKPKPKPSQNDAGPASESNNNVSDCDYELIRKTLIDKSEPNVYAAIHGGLCYDFKTNLDECYFVVPDNVFLFHCFQLGECFNSSAYLDILMSQMFTETNWLKKYPKTGTIMDILLKNFKLYCPGDKVHNQPLSFNLLETYLDIYTIKKSMIGNFVYNLPKFKNKKIPDDIKIKLNTLITRYHPKRTRSVSKEVSKLVNEYTNISEFYLNLLKNLDKTGELDTLNINVKTKTIDIDTYLEDLLKYISSKTKPGKPKILFLLNCTPYNTTVDQYNEPEQLNLIKFQNKLEKVSKEGELRFNKFREYISKKESIIETKHKSKTGNKVIEKISSEQQYNKGLGSFVVDTNTKSPANVRSAFNTISDRLIKKIKKNGITLQGNICDSKCVPHDSNSKSLIPINASNKSSLISRIGHTLSSIFKKTPKKPTNSNYSKQKYNCNVNFIKDSKQITKLMECTLDSQQIEKKIKLEKYSYQPKGKRRMNAYSYNDPATKHSSNIPPTKASKKRKTNNPNNSNHSKKAKTSK